MCARARSSVGALRSHGCSINYATSVVSYVYSLMSPKFRSLLHHPNKAPLSQLTLSTCPFSRTEHLEFFSVPPTKSLPCIYACRLLHVEDLSMRRCPIGTVFCTVLFFTCPHSTARQIQYTINHSLRGIVVP